MSYIENPKTKGSGIICVIPQIGVCPIGCSDCFFQSGRSYLEPLTENLPNLPTLEDVGNRVVRVNDGNDSNNQRDMVIEKTKQYSLKFYNTSIPKDIDKFPAPVVLTLNPGKNTNKNISFLDPIPKNLMFVRVRTNTWNLNNIVFPAVDYYTSKDIPVIFTFMAYYNDIGEIPEDHKSNYIYRKRTCNSYWAITTDAWEKIMSMFKYNSYVYSCGKIEGEKGKSGCQRCGNCLREFFNTTERLK
jgi:hypothetical protein